MLDDIAAAVAQLAHRLGGGMLPWWEYFAPAMFGEVRRRSFTFRHSSTRIEAAALGAEAGLIGAACLPLQARFRVGLAASS